MGFLTTSGNCQWGVTLWIFRIHFVQFPPLPERNGELVNSFWKEVYSYILEFVLEKLLTEFGSVILINGFSSIARLIALSAFSFPAQALKIKTFNLVANLTILGHDLGHGYSPSCNSIVDIPYKQIFRYVRVRAIKNESESTIYDFTPSYASTIMESYPCRSSDSISNEILNCHISREFTSICYVGSFTEGTVRPWDIMMVSGNHHWTLQFWVRWLLVFLQGCCWERRRWTGSKSSYLKFPWPDEVIEPCGQSNPPNGITVKNPCLRANYHIVLPSFTDPLEILLV